MGYQLINLMALVAIGVIVANMIAHSQGTTAFFNGLGRLWGISINGMLGTPTSGINLNS